jgi:hypothetical protein
MDDAIGTIRKAIEPARHYTDANTALDHLEAIHADLLAALEPIIERLVEIRFHDEGGWMYQDEWIDAGRAAIAKAKGLPLVSGATESL